MEKEKLEQILIDYIDGKLSAEERSRVEAELTQNPVARETYEELKVVLDTIDHVGELEPTIRLRQGFDDALRAETGSIAAKGRQVFFQPAMYRAAAAIFLVLSGVAIGYWVNKNQQQEMAIQAMRIELETTKQLMMSMLDNRQSASQRVLGATVAFKMEKADDQIVEALTKTMNEDPNTNVRLAALEALGKFHQQPLVRKTLVASLATQKDPVVQMALIRLMVEMKEKDAIEGLQRITDDIYAIPAVKDEAHAGILKLS